MENVEKYCFFDIETVSNVDLKRYGVTPYTQHNSFGVVCGVAITNFHEEYIFKNDPSTNSVAINEHIRIFQEMGYRFVCHNVAFEYSAFPQLKNPICTALLSRLFGGPSALADCCKTFLGEDLKQSDGYKLTYELGDRYSDYKDSHSFKALVDYCVDDVHITSKLFFKLREMYEGNAILS